jgi:hypothetical protein
MDVKAIANLGGYALLVIGYVAYEVYAAIRDRKSKGGVKR